LHSHDSVSKPELDLLLLYERYSPLNQRNLNKPLAFRNRLGTTGADQRSLKPLFSIGNHDDADVRPALHNLEYWV
jgi:hypothetical protein